MATLQNIIYIHAKNYCMLQTKIVFAVCLPCVFSFGNIKKQCFVGEMKNDLLNGKHCYRQGILSNNLTIMLTFDFVRCFYQIDHGDQEFIRYLFYF